MHWEITNHDHLGGRDEQQDSTAIFSSQDGQSHLFVVADGMGGHEGGRLASQTVIQVTQSLWQKSSSGQRIPSPQRFLYAICKQAHLQIKKLGKQLGISPSSTCVLVYIDKNEAWWAHLGDSRFYLFRDYKLLTRTKDHSVVQMLTDLGRLKESEMATHPDQNLLLRGLGSGDGPVKPEFGYAQLKVGDSLLLCSDGLWEQLTPEKMLEILLQPHFKIAKKAKFLVGKAIKAGGREGDNVAVVVAQLQGNSLNRLGYVILGTVLIAVLGWSIWNYLT